MATFFPAVVFGGPPRAGKSTLAVRLGQALGLRGVDHYLLRAHPDGEGSWTYELKRQEQPSPERAAYLRDLVKRDWRPVATFAERMARDVARRQLPLLVDLGGRTLEESRLIAGQCTHAVIVWRETADLAEWRAWVEGQGLLVLAELRSDLAGPQTVDDDGPTLRGALSGLDTRLSSDGACFDALLERLARALACDPDELEQTHFAQTGVDLPLNLTRAIPPLPAHSAWGQPWRPEELPALLDSLPRGASLGLYGRAPVWLYAALAAFALPEPVEIFDPRLGWAAPPPLGDGAPPPELLRCALAPAGPDRQRLELVIERAHLDLDEAAGVAVPEPPPGQGLVIDGRMPDWLAAALARHYARRAAWIALYQPPIHAAVVVWSPSGAPAVGELVGGT
jgi:CRISPR-associated protein Csx3